MTATFRALGRLVVVVAAFAAPAAMAQTAPVPPQTQPGSPPVLSTVPSPPDGAVPQPGQMSGLPLQVGDLPPGIVAVRVIRRTFAENVAQQAVELRPDGPGPALNAVTNSDGRAQFDRLAIGGTVRVRAVVDGEVLESQPFELPAQGGVRLVLVAGVGAGSAGGEPVPEAAAVPAATAAAAAGRTAPTVIDRIGAGPIVLLMCAVALAAFTWRRQPRRALRQTAGRDEVFESLVRLEKDFEACRVSEPVYHARRDALIVELMSIDAALTPTKRHV